MCGVIAYRSKARLEVLIPFWADLPYQTCQTAPFTQSMLTPQTTLLQLCANQSVMLTRCCVYLTCVTRSLFLILELDITQRQLKQSLFVKRIALKRCVQNERPLNLIWAAEMNSQTSQTCVYQTAACQSVTRIVCPPFCAYLYFQARHEVRHNLKRDIHVCPKWLGKLSADMR